jgi:hypothetical protein
VAADPTDLAALLAAANRGDFPKPDGGWSRIRQWRRGLEAIVAFTGHAFFAVAEDISDRHIDELGADGYGGAHAPSVIQALAGPGAWIDSLDVILVIRTPERATSGLVERPDLGDHSRVRHAGRIRDDIRVLGYPEIENPSLATVSRGLGGLPEIGVQADEATDGAALLRAALATLPGAQLVVAGVAPGNARALRTFLRVGFQPVASVQVYCRAVNSATTERLRP